MRNLFSDLNWKAGFWLGALALIVDKLIPISFRSSREMSDDFKRIK